MGWKLQFQSYKLPQVILPHILHLALDPFQPE